jgi:hypothetical protein
MVRVLKTNIKPAVNGSLHVMTFRVNKKESIDTIMDSILEDNSTHFPIGEIKRTKRNEVIAKFFHYNA